MNNTLARKSLEIVHTIMQHLVYAQWLFSGWAERLQALCPPRPPARTVPIASIQALPLIVKNVISS